jgi:hypothetical protein
MLGRQSIAAREVAATHRRMAPPSLARIPETRSLGRRPRLGRSDPRIDDRFPIKHRRRHTALVRPPTVIEPGRLIAGRHPCAWGLDGAAAEVRDLTDAGVTLFLDLTTRGELEPYAALVSPPARHVNRPIRDFSIPSRDALVATLDEIDAEIGSGGLVYVHCWAGCGRTGVVVGAWLVRHGAQPDKALQRIAEARGLGCPQTLEQRVFVLDWRAGL